MPIEFIGYVGTCHESEIHPRVGPIVDVEFTRALAREHERAGFDRVLIGYFSHAPDGFLVASHVAAHTERLGLLLAHRPGFVAPPLAARKIATLDQFTGGRLALHVISGGSDEDQRRDGDFVGHDDRYARTDEYLEVLRRVWTETEPFDHHGRFYRFERAFSEVKPKQTPHVPICFGGASEPALAVAGKHADVYALWGESKQQVHEQVTRVRAEAAKHGRSVRFSVSFRPILAATEQAAWERAEQILEETRRLRVEQGFSRGGPQQSEGARRLLAAAGDGVRADDRLWTAIAKEIGGRSNSTALVGTPQQVAQTLAEYHALGVTTFLIRGFDPLEDAIDYGREPRTDFARASRRLIRTTHTTRTR
jgi:alkanesulfonate monooxygenase